MEVSGGEMSIYSLPVGRCVSLSFVVGSRFDPCLIVVALDPESNFWRGSDGEINILKNLVYLCAVP